ncbi:hypothetical protein FHS18_005329 [Paenibacillus phyllosphaerae]|uniref:DUF4259 domain-containing protein n=1 Tax=Paenibacillus phyllosphaerae TaxID=274593 RepID=A0A7W5B3V1_9BACL|nr:DUF4259 domain-containing protein [Paenibacillus phyllosphaerae]MBB3113226.1 hypothetical protein [Paenibacillus phyllosphaerae]
MGAWGPGIFDNDMTCDVRDEFNALLAQGLSVIEATSGVLESYEMELEDEDPEMVCYVYLGLAGAQLEHAALLPEVSAKAIEVIEQGADLELWEESTGEDYAERKAMLEAFKQQLKDFTANVTME